MSASPAPAKKCIPGNKQDFENKLLETWQQTASPVHLDILKGKLKAKLVFAWQRMGQGDLYKCFRSNTISAF